MALKITSATHRGLDGVLISVEVDITRGIPSFNIIVYIGKIIQSLPMTQLYKAYWKHSKANYNINLWLVPDYKRTRFLV